MASNLGFKGIISARGACFFFGGGSPVVDHSQAQELQMDPAWPAELTCHETAGK